MLDGVGGRGRTAPIPPPSSRQTSMEVSSISVLEVMEEVVVEVVEEVVEVVAVIGSKLCVAP